MDPAAPTKTMVTEAGRSRRRAYRTKKEEGARKKLKICFWRGAFASVFFLKYFFARGSGSALGHVEHRGSR